jgi:hypothetical protein
MRAWGRFRGNRLGYRSLLLFVALGVLSLFAEVLSNDKPLLVRYQRPLVRAAGADPARDHLRRRLPDPHGLPGPVHPGPAGPARELRAVPASTATTTAPSTTSPGSPTRPRLQPAELAGHRRPRAGTCWRGCSTGSGCRCCSPFAVTVVCTLAGVVYGAIQGYFAGWTDIAMERVVELWGAMPTLYLLIIFSAFFAPSVGLLVALISIFGWLMHRGLRARRVPEEPQPGLRAGRPGAGPAEPGDHLPAHPAQLPDPGDHAGAVRDGRGHRRAHQPGLPGPGRARGHPEPGRAAGPGQEQPGRLVDLPGHLHGAGGDPGAADPGGGRPARRAGPAQGDRRRRTP